MTEMMALYDEGMSCLLKNLGVIRTEQFIAAVKRENFDYTKWQRKHFDSMQEGTFTKQAREYAMTHPYTGQGKEI